MTDKTKTYYVTDAGDPRPLVGGKRCRVGDPIELTETQAETELSRGMVSKTKPEEKSKSKAK